MKCAICHTKECMDGKDCTDIADAAKSEMEKNLDSMRLSASIESRYYMKKTRLEELILYCKGMKYEKLGIAFCIGLEEEARTIDQILEKDFEVHSVCCKVCGVDKSEFDLERLKDGIDPTCNPIGQAMILNREKTELNIILGLCIGHDILFTKYSEAPVTTLVVKDRVLAHIPLGAIYSRYFRARFS